jgi:hypothetical protein
VPLDRDAVAVLRRVKATPAAEELAAEPGEYFGQGFAFSDKHGRPFKLDAPEQPAEVSLHSLRHSFASSSIASDGDIVAVQRCLRHSVPSTTLNLYSHVVASGREKAVAAASDTLRQAQTSPCSWREMTLRRWRFLHRLHRNCTAGILSKVYAAKTRIKSSAERWQSG